MVEKDSLNLVVQIEPVAALPPWNISSHDPETFLHLSGHTADEDVGLIVAMLFANRFLLDPVIMPTDSKQLLGALLADEELLLDGGIQAKSATGIVISPGCCCGLEEWRDWANKKPGDASPWLGHDPWAWVEYKEDKVRVWADGGISGEDLSSTPHIDMSWAEYNRQIIKAGNDLNEFSQRLKDWAAKVEPTLASDFAEHFSGYYGLP